MTKQPWDKDSEDRLDDLYLDSLTSVAMVILVVIVCAFLTGLVYGLAQPWVNEILAAWEFKP